MNQVVWSDQRIDTICDQGTYSLLFYSQIQEFFSFWYHSHVYASLGFDYCVYKLLACYFFMDTGRRHKTPRSETKDFITHYTAINRYSSVSRADVECQVSELELCLNLLASLLPRLPPREYTSQAYQKLLVRER